MCGHLAAIASYLLYADFYPIVEDCQTVKLQASENGPNLDITWRIFVELLVANYIATGEWQARRKKRLQQDS